MHEGRILTTPSTKSEVRMHNLQLESYANPYPIIRCTTIVLDLDEE